MVKTTALKKPAVEATISNRFDFFAMDTEEVAKEKQTFGKITPVILRSNGKYWAVFEIAEIGFNDY